jgi:putative RecB family exonuclease
MLYVSYSRLSCFDQCPRKYEFQYIRQIPAMISPVLFLGQVVHLTLHRYFTGGVEFRDAQGLHDLFRQTWKEERAKYRAQNLYQLDRETERVHGIKGLEMLSQFFHSSHNTPPHESEKLVRFKIGEDILFTGKVDRLERISEGFRIVDYKTGKYTARFLDTLQLHTYAWLMVRSGYLIHSSAFLYLEEGNFVEEKVTDQIIEQTEQALREKIHALVTILESGSFPPKPSKLCGWCDYQDLCEEGEKYGG